MTAARMADIRMPAIQGLKRRPERTMKTRSWFCSTREATSRCSAKKAAPKKPTATAPERQKLIQRVATRRAFGITLMERVAMKRTRMCGWPK